MAPFNPFPAGYQPYTPYPGGYQPQQYQPAPQVLPTQMSGANQQQQTKYVEVVPVDTVQEAEACPMAAGSSFLFFARDDTFIAVKSVGVNGQQSFSVFDKRPPAPSTPPFNPAEYVRRDELQGLVFEAMASHKRGKPQEAASGSDGA